MQAAPTPENPAVADHSVPPARPAASNVSLPDGRGSYLAAALSVWALFLSMSFVRAPIPAVNEPHYLGKARYWWNPAWCAGDFFLQSSNPHAVFYAAVGWLTHFLSLPQTALVARVVALGLLAGGWVAWTRSLPLSRSASLAAGALLCLAMAYGNFSGEWLIGGIESKVFAYAAAVWGAACWNQGRVAAAAALAAAATAFHPVAGLWIIIAAAMAFMGGVRFRREELNASTPWRALSRRSQAIALCVLVGGTSLALVPALPLVLGGDPEVSRAADRLLLTQRVGHHTDPLLFTARSYWYYAGLLSVWLVLAVRGEAAPAWRAWRRFVAASLVIAAVGLLVGWLPEFSTVDRLAPWRLWLLKFYPFRLADLALPAAVALELARCWAPAQPPYATADPLDGIRSRAVRQLWVSLAVAAAAWAAMLALPAPDANPSGMSAAHYADWIKVCDWLRRDTPPDALIGCANEDWGVKWFADRAEYVNFKDCPQDAAGVVEWWRRRQGLVAWSRRTKADGRISPADLAELHAETGIDYFVVSRFGPIDAATRFVQGPFRVYALEP